MVVFCATACASESSNFDAATSVYKLAGRHILFSLIIPISVTAAAQHDLIHQTGAAPPVDQLLRMCVCAVAVVIIGITVYETDIGDRWRNFS